MVAYSDRLGHFPHVHIKTAPQPRLKDNRRVSVTIRIDKGEKITLGGL